MASGEWTKVGDRAMFEDVYGVRSYFKEHDLRVFIDNVIQHRTAYGKLVDYEDDLAHLHDGLRCLRGEDKEQPR